MSNKTRYFVLTAGAILAIGLTTGLVASFMGLPVAFSRAAGPDELQYVPADATVVAHANVRDVMSSDFRQRFRKYETDTHERDEFQEKTGVNIEEDIQTVTAALLPGGLSGTDWHHDKGVLVIARGRFEPARLEALALEHGGSTEQYQGKQLLIHVKDTGEPDMAVGFLESDLIAFGGYAAVKQAIDASTTKNIVSNTELMRQINDLESSSAWAVGNFAAIANAGHIPDEVRAYMPAIQSFSAAGHVNGGVSGVFKAEARDDASAQNLRDLLRGFIALAKLQAESRPEIKTMVDSVQLSGEGKNVAIAFTIPSELFDVLEALGQQHRQQIEPRQ